RGAELRARRGRWIRAKSGTEAVAEEAVHGPETQRARVAGARHGLVVLEQPGQLPGGEVGIERHAAALAHLVGQAVALEAIEHLLRALVLPGHDRGERAAALG